MAYTKKLAAVAEAVLQPDEALLAGVRGMSKGSTKHIVGGAAGGVAGGAIGAVVGQRVGKAEREEGADQLAGAGLPTLPPQLALGLTHKRLLIFSRSTVSGKAKDLVAEIPRDRIARIEGEDKGKLAPNRLTVHLKDGASVDFEIVRLDGFQTIVDAFG
ncbi:MAG: hypothetical protein WEE36_03105 [Acidimicrobiia bacterium]